MTTIPPSVRELLATGPLAHVVTLHPDGTPHVTLAWAGLDGDEIVVANFQGRARITEGGALEVMDRLAEFHLGPGQKYPMREVPEGLVIHVAVERIYGQGPWGP